MGKAITCARHLVDAVISATVETVLKKMEGSVNRRFDDEIGLDIMEF